MPKGNVLNLYFIYVPDSVSHLWICGSHALGMLGVPPAVRCEGGVTPQTSCHDEDLTTVHTPHAWPIQGCQLAYCVRLWTVSGNQSLWWESTGRHRKNMQGGREWNPQPLYLSGLIDKPTGLMCALAWVRLCSFIMHHVKRYWMWWTSGVISTSQGEI